MDLRHLLVCLAMLTVACPPSDGGPEVQNPECLLDEDCAALDACTRGQCFEGSCRVVRPEGAATLLGSFATRSDARAVDLNGNWLHAGGVTSVDSYSGVYDFPAESLTRAVERTPSAPVEWLQERGSELLVAEGAIGVEVYDDRDATLLASYLSRAEARSVFLQGSSAGIAVHGRGVELVDLSSGWAAATRIDRIDTPGRAASMLERGGLLYVADGLGGVAVVDAGGAIGSKLRTDLRIETEGRVERLDREGSRLLLAEGLAGIGLVELSPDPELERPATEEGLPARMAEVALGSPVLDVDFFSEWTAVALTADGRVVVLDLMDYDDAVRSPANLRVWQTLETELPARAMSRDGERIAIAAGAAGAALVDLGCTVPEPEDG